MIKCDFGVKSYKDLLLDYLKHSNSDFVLCCFCVVSRFDLEKGAF